MKKEKNPFSMILFVGAFAIFLLIVIGISGGFSGNESASSKVTSSEVTSSEGPKGISDKEKKELVENGNYKKACELKEFSTAYEILDKLKEKTTKEKIKYDADKQYSWRKGEAFSRYEEAKKISDEAERYVVLQEALFVLESEGTNGVMRIVGIAKEHNAEGWLYIELLDVAKKIGDTDLANRFETLIQSTISNLSNMSLSDISLINYLAGKNDKQLSEKILGLLTEEENNIPNRPSLGIVMVHDPYGGSNMNKEEYLNYEKAVSNFNKECQTLLKLAINNKNQYLAQRVVTKVKSNISYVNLGDWEKVINKTRNSSWNYAWKFSTSDEEANAIKKTYQEAVRSGAFK